MLKQNLCLDEIDIINDELYDIENNEKKIADSDIHNEKDIIKQDGTKITLLAEDALKLINNGIKDLKLAKTMITKIVRVHQNNEKKLFTKTTKNTTRSATGIMEKKKVPEKIVSYLGLDENVDMVRNKIVSKFYSKFKEDGLCYEKDKRVFRVNSELMELFNLPQSVNYSTNVQDKNGFNFFNLPTYIASVYKMEALKEEAIKEKAIKKEALKNEKKLKKKKLKDKDKTKRKDKKKIKIVND